MYDSVRKVTVSVPVSVAVFGQSRISFRIFGALARPLPFSTFAILIAREVDGSRSRFVYVLPLHVSVCRAECIYARTEATGDLFGFSDFRVTHQRSFRCGPRRDGNPSALIHHTTVDVCVRMYHSAWEVMVSGPVSIAVFVLPFSPFFPFSPLWGRNGVVIGWPCFARESEMCHMRTAMSVSKVEVVQSAHRGRLAKEKGRLGQAGGSDPKSSTHLAPTRDGNPCTARSTYPGGPAGEYQPPG